MTITNSTCKGLVKATLVAALLLLVEMQTHARRIAAVSRHDVGTQESQDKAIIPVTLIRSKRSADVMVTDKVSRKRATLTRQAHFLHLLSIADTSMGGTCNCLLQGKRHNPQRRCHCNVTNLLSTLLQSLRSPTSKLTPALKDAIKGLDQSQRRNLFNLVGRELKRALRARAIERLRLKRLRAKVMRRRRMILKHPRAAFDGVQSFFF